MSVKVSFGSGIESSTMAERLFCLKHLRHPGDEEVAHQASDAIASSAVVVGE